MMGYGECWTTEVLDYRGTYVHISVKLPLTYPINSTIGVTHSHHSGHRDSGLYTKAGVCGGLFRVRIYGARYI